MGNWREKILNEFIPNVNKLTLVADPDSLLTEEKLAFALRQKGFELIEFHDAIEFRYAYESKYRSNWDQGKQTDLVVILRLEDAELDALPFDLLQAGRKLSFNLGDLFPALSYPVIEKLDRSLLDKVFTAQQGISSERLGDNQTKDFILRHVFQIAPELITSEAGLLQNLLRLHYNKLVIPEILVDRLVDVFLTSKRFTEWPLKNLISDAKTFFAFLQERWPIYLQSIDRTQKVREDATGYGLHIEGPATIPFDHQDVRVIIDNLFIEGKLTPIEAPEIKIENGSWVKIGMRDPGVTDDSQRILRLLELVTVKEQPETPRAEYWKTLAMRWAELSSLMYKSNKNEHRDRFDQLGEEVNTAFAAWLKTQYSSLINTSPAQPAMLHHIPRFIERELENKDRKRIALLVVDGLAFDQWVTIRNILQKQNDEIVFREDGIFAWIPTITSVSRQALFAGKQPLYFPKSITTTNREQTLWENFWIETGFSKSETVYKRGLGDGDPAVILQDEITASQNRVLGLVIDKVDGIMHGMQLGSAGMHNQIEQWCRGEFLSNLLNLLLENKYDIWLTSDHGNIECVGRGRLSEGAIADTRGERVRVYKSRELRTRYSSTLDYGIEWEPLGLPKKYLPLVATGHNAFVTKDETIVGHGGISIEEVIVPFIKIESRTDQ